MHIKIDTEIPFPKWAQLASLALICGVGVGIGVRAFASPPTWTAGEPLTAAGLTQLSVMTNGSASISVGATKFVGATSGTHTGDFLHDAHAGGALNGYQAAANICRAEVTGATPTIHLCTGEEIVRSAALGISQPLKGGGVQQGWYSAFHGTDAGNAADCGAWTGSGGDNQGSATLPAGGGDYFSSWGASRASCIGGGTGPLVILCCD